MLREPTLARAAAAAGVNERTLRRWLAEVRFRSALLAARRQAFGQAIGLTQRYAPVAVAALVKVLNDATASASARVAAAAVLLRFGREGIELDDLAERVEALERAADVPPAEPADVLAVLTEQANAVRADVSLDAAERARTLGLIAGVALRAMEARDLAARLEAVERVLKIRRDQERQRQRDRKGYGL